MRRRTLGSTLLPAVVAAFAAGAVAAADWPQYRGPGQDGRSSETGLLREWPEGGPPLAWKAAGLPFLDSRGQVCRT